MHMITKSILRLILIIAYAIDCTGLNHLSYVPLGRKEALRPAASVLSKSDLGNTVEYLKALLDGSGKIASEVEPTDDIRELMKAVIKISELRSREGLPEDALWHLQNLIDKNLLSTTLKDSLPDQIKEEAQSLNEEVNNLLQDTAQDEIAQILSEEPDGPEPKRVFTSQRLREIGKLLLTTAIIITAAKFGYGYILKFREWCLPLATIVIAAGVTSLADLMRQRGQAVAGSEKGTHLSHIFRWSALSILYDGLLTGFLWHDKCLMGNAAERGLKIALDQGVFAPLFFIPFPIMLAEWFIEKNPFKKAVKNSIQKWLGIYLLCLTAWPFILYVAYFGFTEEAPVLTVIIAKFIWMTGISYIVHRAGDENIRIIDRNFKIYKVGMICWITSLFCVLCYFYSPWLLAISGLGVAWSFFYYYQLTKIVTDYDRQDNMEKAKTDEAATNRPSDYSERFDDIAAKAMTLQKHLIEYIMTKLHLPQAKVVAAGQELSKHKLLHHLESSG